MRTGSPSTLSAGTTVYSELALFEPNVSAALKVVDDLIAPLRPPQAAPDRVLLFTGHMLDARPIARRAGCGSRRRPRPKPKRVDSSRRRSRPRSPKAARCAALPAAPVAATSSSTTCAASSESRRASSWRCHARSFRWRRCSGVDRAGLSGTKGCVTACRRVLPETDALPNWLVDKPDYDVWRRNNEWMLFNALAAGARRLR